MEQRIAVLVTVILGLTLVALFARVARSAGEAGSAEEIAIATARWRRTVFWGLVLVFVPVIGYSLTRTPYATGKEQPAVVISATGHQWSWEISPSAVPVGEPVEIRVTAADVNHGFAVYDSLGHIVTQTQAMPGFTNVLHHTFTTPGTYRVLCLEYCGLGHHTMASPLVVTATTGARP